MIKVSCYECGRAYDYEEDAFCPKCGAFNQPPRSARIGADGSVVRVDGLNERGHKGSFVHQELHTEDRERRRIGLEKGVRRIPQTSRANPAPSSPKEAALAWSKPKKRRNPLQLVGWIIGAMILWNFLSVFFHLF